MILKIYKDKTNNTIIKCFDIVKVNYPYPLLLVLLLIPLIFILTHTNIPL